MVNHVFWAGVANKSHLYYGFSWLRELLSRESERVELHMMGARSFFTAEEITCDEIATILDDPGFTVTQWDGSPAPRSDRIWMLSTGAVGIKPWLRLREVHRLRRIPVIVSDEGLGSYGNWKARWQAMARQGVGEPHRTLRTFAVAVATATLTTRRWPLHLHTSSGWVLNKPAAAEFRRHAPTISPYPRAVFLSQPWVEMGFLSEDRYLQHIDCIAQNVLAHDLDFAVLPHPGEDQTRYRHWQVHAPTSLAEFNPVALSARVLLGASSTAMVNLASLYGISAMRVGTPELLQLDEKLTKHQASLLNQYVAPSVNEEDFGRRLSAVV